MALATCVVFLTTLAVGTLGHSISLSGPSWKVSNTNGSISIPAKVPGGVYSDLQRAGIISDPYYRFNDVLQRWVSNEDWTWTSTFSVPESTLAFANLNLVFHGIDTVARVILNGKEILSTDNMFRRYRVDVRGILKTENELVVKITSPIFYALNQFTEYYNNNYTVYPTSHPNAQHGVEHANFVRKMQSSFSWDWGPAFPSLGIWKDVEIEYYESVKLRDVVVGLAERENHWNVTLALYVEGNQLPSEVTVKADLEGIGQLFSGSAPIVDGKIVLTNINIDERKVRRWWPNGFGEQVLYKLGVDVDGSSKEVKIGFRTVKVVQSTIPGATGLSFYFKVNGWPVYAKGSNLIPIEVLQEKVTKEKIRRIMQATKDANMNMLRIWGGGTYELDEVYEAADEMGILIWQDMMFACALYPTNKEFLDTVSEELRQNVRRIQHHTSIALWAGNNENEMAISGMWWPETLFDITRYKNDYRTLYVHTMKPIIEEIDPWRTYIISSPSNGLETDKENFVASDPNSSLYGDVHFYNYLIDSWNPSNFPSARFVSEFGFQSFPSLRTWKQATDTDEDLVFPLSELVNHRQHHTVVLIIPGNANLERKVYSKFNGPKVNLSSTDQFGVFCYLTQINQAMSIKTAVEKFRRDRSTVKPKSGEGNNMGALYWQLNDVWQAPTWASLEYDGTWKMLHNYAKNFFEPVLITAHRESSLWSNKDIIEVWLISELEAPEKVNVTVEVFSFDSFKPIRSILQEKTLCSDCSMLSNTLNTEDLFAEPCSTDRCFLIVSMFDKKKQLISENWLLAEAPKKIKTLIDADIKVTSVDGPKLRSDGRNEFEIVVEASAPAPFTWLEAGSVAGHFSDNGFFLHAPKKFLNFITSDGSITQDQLTGELSVIQYSRSVDLA
ncbi:beta-mannosidase [Galendromus occidentalis]|uniref:beta-mannosidase n=1 Tax=Galendromus occidentalis TaxID=34638 RepID=A0AAJ6QM96_9ACAR|nr:beta-mannosidase [Galendromus occidentalis]